MTTEDPTVFKLEGFHGCSIKVVQIPDDGYRFEVFEWATAQYRSGTCEVREHAIAEAKYVASCLAKDSQPSRMRRLFGW